MIWITESVVSPFSAIFSANPTVWNTEYDTMMIVTTHHVEYFKRLSNARNSSWSAEQSSNGTHLKNEANWKERIDVQRVTSPKYAYFVSLVAIPLPPMSNVFLRSCKMKRATLSGK